MTIKVGAPDVICILAAFAGSALGRHAGIGYWTTLGVFLLGMIAGAAAWHASKG